ncbi:MAG: uroporphyrinogen-III C-methyltransferase [Rhodospirillales bacterium]|nr:uroporphyrinogen-III C-methyltransferase [Rhodospirillales bacterium]
MRHFPAFLDLVNRPTLVVGGGLPAWGKIQLLRRAGAQVTVVAAEAVTEIDAAATRREITWRRRSFQPRDLAGKAVVIAASDVATDTLVSTLAKRRNIPFNAVDRPELSTFIAPAIVDRDPVMIAVSTGGASPALARRVRARIESLLPTGFGRLAQFAERFRSAVRATVPEETARRRFWERLFDGPVAARLMAGDDRGAGELMLGLVNRRGEAASGSIALVGAGPGDPDLLTLRTLQYLQGADVVVHDRLVSAAILDRARRGAQFLDVGKDVGAGAKAQDRINALLVRLVREGKRVVRLKGGDPFIFGRGGEEKAYLEAAGIAVDVVPGITAATGCAASAKIALTGRGVAQAVTFVTGRGEAGDPDVDWAALAQLGQTLVVYMGLARIETIAATLIAHGRDAATPAAIVENGTRANQRVLTGRLDQIAAVVRAAAVRGPALLIVGEVAADAVATANTAAAAASSLALAG